MTAEPIQHECDLVMRGGIASGIVYPEALATLAKKYRFRCIGGTSAGAIAAAVAAAAEYGRQVGGKPDAFETVRKLAASLAEPVGGRGRIASLFGAPAQTRLLLHLLMAATGSDWAKQQLTPAARVVLRALSGGGGAGAGKRVQNFLRDIGGTLPVGLANAVFWPLLVLLAFATAGGAAGAALVFVLIFAAIGIPLFHLVRLGQAVLAATNAMPENFLGITTGMRPADSDEEGLTEWMHRVMQEVAGRAPDAAPITFGDLWGADRRIQLQLITTNATRGTSCRLPDLEDTRRGREHFRGRLYFRESQMRKLFPEPVVRWLVAHAQPMDDLDHLVTGDPDFHRLPLPADLPILMAARMSLSFPVLLAQVPLYSPDPTDENARAGGVVLNWFSDGGITSNFPISIFDGPLPRRPTFGINLVPLLRAENQWDGTPAMKKRVRMPDAEHDFVVTRLFDPARKRDADGVARIPVPGGIAQLLAYTSALNDTARNWAETELTSMPGYRDRIVHIELSDVEGGLNLDMPPSLVARVAARGRTAAEVLLARFHPDGPAIDPITAKAAEKAWARHRWTRARAFFSGYEELARKFLRGWHDRPIGGEPPFRELMQRPGEAGWRYTLTERQAEWAGAVTPKLVAALEESFSPGDARGEERSFDLGDEVAPGFPRLPSQGRSPRPKMVLRMGAPRGNDPGDTFTPRDLPQGHGDLMADAGAPQGTGQPAPAPV